MFRTNIFGENNRYAKYKDRANGSRNGNGGKNSIYADGYGNGNGRSWLRKSVDGINNLVRTSIILCGPQVRSPEGVEAQTAMAMEMVTNTATADAGVLGKREVVYGGEEGARRCNCAY
jgi:hypothetical protein